MKILEITNFSAGACGVWMRVKQESELLAKKGHTVKVFSSNFIKGTNDLAVPKEKIGALEITRFPAKKLGGESYMRWDFQKDAIAYSPDVIIVHSYRHLHTMQALKLKKLVNCKVFLVTHAPFMSDSERSFLGKISRKFYDLLIGPAKLKKFDKVIAITKWEIPILKELGVSGSKIVYIPNGIPRDFFTKKESFPEKKILFLGRVSPIKSIETVLYALPLLNDSEIIFEIVGPSEGMYLTKLKKIIQELKIEKRVAFSDPVYKLKNKIDKIDSARIFVLPSKREGMPQALIEAMARKKIVLASNNFGSQELIQNGKNGFLFKIGNHKELAEKINRALRIKSNNIGTAARDSVEQFSWDKIIKKLEKLINQPNTRSDL